MSEEILAKAHEVLDNYMESNHHRRTPERSTILDTIYSMGCRHGESEIHSGPGA